MTTPRRNVLIAGAIALLTLPLLAFAGGGLGPGFGHAGLGLGGLGHGGFGHGDGDHAMLAARILDHLGERLELTDAQTDELSALLEDHRLENEPRWAEMKSASEALHAAMMSETFDEGAVRVAVREAAAVSEELAVSHASLMAEARTVFTPEQIEELQAMHDERGERRHRRMMHRGHGGTPDDAAPTE